MKRSGAVSTKASIKARLAKMAGSRPLVVDADFISAAVGQLSQPGKFHTVKELAKLWDMSEDWVVKNVCKTAGCLQLGRRWIIPQAALDAFIRSEMLR